MFGPKVSNLELIIRLMEITKLSHFWTIYYNSNDLALADYPNLSPRSDLEPNYLEKLQSIGSKVYYTKISHRLFQNHQIWQKLKLPKQSPLTIKSFIGHFDLYLWCHSAKKSLTYSNLKKCKNQRQSVNLLGLRTYQNLGFEARSRDFGKFEVIADELKVFWPWKEVILLKNPKHIRI